MEEKEPLTPVNDPLVMAVHEVELRDVLPGSLVGMSLMDARRVCDAVYNMLGICPTCRESMPCLTCGAGL